MPQHSHRLWRRAQRYALLAATACGVVIAAGVGLPSVWRLPPQNPVPAALSGQGIADYLNGLDAPGIRRLEDYAFTLLHQNALDAEALQYLVVAAGLKKDTQRQEVLALNAARYTMRDSRTQLTAVNIALQKKQYDDAFFHLDGLLRARPDLGQQFYATLAALISSNEALPALTRVLAASPPWRRNLLSFLAQEPQGWPVMQRLFESLRKAGDETPASEMRLLLSSLESQGNFEQAYFVWLDSLDASGLARVQNIFDGGFDMEPQGLYFDWTLRPAKNAQIDVLNRPGNSTNRALRLDFANYQGAFSHVTQYLRLTPGQYVLRYDMQVQNLSATRGLVWRLRCVETKTVFGESAEIVANGPWTSANALVTVPDANCATQLLQLESVARNILDTRLSGQIFLDDVALEPVTAQAPAAGDGAQ